MINKENFSINHILSPNVSINNFIKLAKNIGLKKIELRNDLSKINIKKQNPKKIAELSIKNKVKIISINALQKFNIWNKKREEELINLCNFAKKCNCESVVLVPLNNGNYTNYNQRRKILSYSLKNISIILNDYGLLGLIEPLGFKTSSLRYKIEAIETIDSIRNNSSLRILHDTFHHYLSNEKKVFPEYTKLVHISGVSKKIIKSKMRDKHRVMIDKNDHLENLKQIKMLINKGYKKNFSFEPFSKKIQNITDPSSIILSSMQFIKSKLN